MMDLTQYQTNVGTLLTKGNTLLQAGDLTTPQEQEVKGQVDLLNQEWEDLRVGAMERQTRWVTRMHIVKSTAAANPGEIPAL